MAKAHACLEARSIRKVYSLRAGLLGGKSGEVLAVDDVSFTLQHGESLGIVGESGSGKTTIAKVLVGLEKLTAGELTLCGRRIGTKIPRASERRRNAKDIQIVFQNPYQSLDPRQTILRMIEEPLALHGQASGRRERADRARELLAEVGLDERVAAALPQRLSGGERQRVAIARALAVQPRCLVLDEAVSSLDMSVQAQVLNLVSATRRREGLALVVITHDLAVANQICDNLIVLHQGSVVERGPKRRILDNAQHPYTRRLRAAVPTPGWTPTRRRTSQSLSP